MNKRIVALLLIAAGGVAVFSSGIFASAAGVTTVTPSDLSMEEGAWYFWNDVNDTPDTSEVVGEYEFTTGPGTPPLGNESITMSVNGSERWNISTFQYAGTLLSDIHTLGFSTYQPSDNPGSDQRAIFLNFDVDFDNTVESGYQGRLVYVPRQNGTVTQDEWQNWDAINNGEARWWWSRYAGNGTKWLDGETAEYRTWNEILEAFPNAEIMHETWSGQFLFRAGEPYADGFTGSVDAVLFNDTTWNFEITLVGDDPEIKANCKEGGWETYGFKNQGLCIQFINTGKDSRSDDEGSEG